MAAPYRGYRTLARGISLVLTFASALVLGVALHANVGAVRRLLLDRVNAALEGLSFGRVRLDGLLRFSPMGARVGTVVIEMDGVARLEAHDVEVDTNLIGLAARLLTHRSEIVVDVNRVSISWIDAELRPGPGPVRKEGGAGPPLYLDVRAIAVAHLYAHGPLGSAAFLDADVNRSHGSFALSPAQMRTSVSSHVEARSPTPVPVSIDLDGSATVPLAGSDIPRRVQAGLTVRAADARAEIDATLQGNRLSVDLMIPELSPASLRRIVPGLPIAAPVSLHLNAEGPLSSPDFHMNLLVGSGSVTATGSVVLEGTQAVRALVRARDVDLAELVAALPASSIGADAEVSLERAESPQGPVGVRGSVVAQTIASRVAGEVVPPVQVHVDLDPEEIRAAVRARHREMDLLARGTLRGRTFDAHATLDTGSWVLFGASGASAHVKADASGTLTAYRARITAAAKEVRRGKLHVSRLMAIIDGTPSLFDAELGGTGGSVDVIAVQASVSQSERWLVSDLSARVERSMSSIVVSVPTIAVGQHAVDADEITMTGLGDPIRADVHVDDGRIRGWVVGRRIDLRELEAFLPEQLRGLSGTADLAFDVDVGGSQSNGRVELRLSGVRGASSLPVDASLDAALTGKKLEGVLVASYPDLGSARVEVDVAFERAPSSLDDLRTATGHVLASTQDVPLDRVCSVVTCPVTLAESLGAVHATGNAALELSRARQDRNKLLHGNLQVDVDDEQGRLAFLRLRTEAPFARGATLPELSPDSPFEAEFGFEARPIEQLPVVLRPYPVSGFASLHGYGQGTIGKPFVVVELRGSELRNAGSAGDLPPFELSWVTTLDDADVTSDVDLRLGARHVVKAAIDGKASLSRLLKGGRDVSWSGGINAELDHFPLDAMPAIAGKDASGALSGKIDVSGLHLNPEAEGQLSVDDLRVADERIGPLKLSFELTRRRCLLTASGGSVRGAAGTGAMLRASAACGWQDDTVPFLVGDQPVDVALEAHNFALASVEPLVSAVFARFRGSLDARIHARGRPDQGIGQWDLSGDLALRNGSMLPNLLGREISRMDLDASANGRGTVQITGFAGNIGGGSFRGRGAFSLEGSSIGAASGELHVPHRRPIPVTLEGVSYGTVWGDVYLQGRMTGGQFLANLQAPTLRLELPPQTTGDLERLDPNPAVVVLQPMSPTTTTKAVGGGPGAPAQSIIVANVRLGENVGISRDDLKIELTTPKPPENPTITLGNQVKINGELRILGGRVPAAGRVFRIERGVVTFGGDDPGDPALDVDAVYEGETSITVRVHVAGTAKDMKLTLQSTPPKSEGEILSILAFGEAPPASTSTGAVATPATGVTSGIAGAAGTAAAGVGTALLTTGLNQILSQSVIPIRAGVSAGTTSQVSAAATVDLSERFRIEYIRSFGTSSQVGQTLQDENQFALDWRFKARWMLRMIVGTRGTAAFDLLWQRWY